MPIPYRIFQRQAPVICRVAEIWGESHPRSIMGKAADALLQGWGVRATDYGLLDRKLIVVIKEEDADASPTAMR